MLKGTSWNCYSSKAFFPCTMSPLAPLVNSLSRSIVESLCYASIVESVEHQVRSKKGKKIDMRKGQVEIVTTWAFPLHHVTPTIGELTVKLNSESLSFCYASIKLHFYNPPLGNWFTNNNRLPSDSAHKLHPLWPWT